MNAADFLSRFDATGAPHDKPLEIEGHDLGNVFGSAGFVGWYNGHPQFAGLDPDLAARLVDVGTTTIMFGATR